MRLSHDLYIPTYWKLSLTWKVWISICISYLDGHDIYESVKNLR